MDELYFEKILSIDTCKSETRMDREKEYNRYEPTPYSCLIQLFKNYEIEKTDWIVDFGSGKGRLPFYINYFYDCPCTGVEIVEEFYEKSVKNLKSYSARNIKKARKIKFVNESAENYRVSIYENKFYFFNPFSINIFRKVVENILRSYEEKSREIDLILYYPDEEYERFLDNRTAFTKVREINLIDKRNNLREKFVVYRIGDTISYLGIESATVIKISTY